MGKKLVVGTGNLLLKDDGVGVHAIRALQMRSLPPEVELLDGGTAGCDLLPYLGGADLIVVIDALKGGGEPGAIYRLSPEDCYPRQGEGGISLHDLGILTALRDLELLQGRPVKTVIFGVEPAEISCGLELTPQVAAALPRLLELVMEELGRE